MEEELVLKRKGNPNFGKPKTDVTEDNASPTPLKTLMSFNHDDYYRFELTGTFEAYKPTDNDTGKKVDSLYPPYWSVPNVGRAYDEEKKKQRKFRYISTEESIWADEQTEMDTAEEAIALSLPENQLEFINGKINISGIQENKIKALLIQDKCENKVKKIKPCVPEFRMIDPETAIKASLSGLNVEFDAIKAAGDASLEDMKEYAYALGINTDQSDEGIKRDFYMQAKANPAFFLKNFVNPVNKYKFTLFNAIRDNLVSANVVTNQLVWVETKQVICEVNSNGNVVDEVSKLALLGNTSVLKMYEQLKK